MTIALNGNGHRRRELRARVLAEETHCGLCDKPVDKTLTVTPNQHGPKCSRTDCPGCVPDPMRAEVDEDLPRARGGSPLDRANCALLHRQCNRWKGIMTLAEARTKLHGIAPTEPAPIKPSAIW